MTTIRGRHVAYRNERLEVVAKEVEMDPPRGIETFWSIRAGEYVAALVLTDDRRIPLVRVYRPAVERFMLELPSGGIEPGETPEAAMRRELLEEVGCDAPDLRLAGRLHTDSGRMETTQWAFYAPGARVVQPAPIGDEPLELVWTDADELRELIRSGAFSGAAHLGVIATAMFAAGAQL